MLWSLALRMNETVTEVALQRGDVQHSKTWWFPRQPLRLLEEYLKSQDVSLDQIEAVRLSSPLFRRNLESTAKPQVAALVTEGFEDWLSISRPVRPGYFTLFPTRSVEGFDPQYIFGVHERVDHKGKVIRAPELEELEQLFAKLELMELKFVAVNFLHANLNSENQDAVVEFLTKKGLRVFANTDQAVELPRWRKTFYQSSMAWHWNNEVDSDPLLQWLKSNNLLEKSSFLSNVGKWSPVASSDWLNSVFCEHALEGSIEPQAPLFYLGYDEFAFFPPNRPIADRVALPLGETLVQHQRHVRPNVQPLLKISDSIRNFGLFKDEEIKPEPGPMCWGRGRVPCVIDAISLIAPLPGLELADLQKRKIAENVFAMFKENFENRSTSIEDFVSGLNRALGSLVFHFLSEVVSDGEIKVTGPLAPWLLQMNEMQPSGLKLKLVEISNHALRMLEIKA